MNEENKKVENIESIKEKSNSTKDNKIKKVLATVAGCAIIFVGANVYASTQGYDNIFFLIKHVITGEVSSNSKEEILSDRDFTISYEPIHITENISIIVSKLQIKDNQATLFVKVKEGELEKDIDIVPLKYKMYNAEGKELATQRSGRYNNSTQYTEELILWGLTEKDKTIKLEVYKNNSELISTLLIDLEKRVITVEGEKVALQKISEIELKEFLGHTAALAQNKINTDSTYTDEDIMIATAIEMAVDKKIKPVKGPLGKYMYKLEDVDNMVKSVYGKSIKDLNNVTLLKKSEMKINNNEYIEFKEAGDMIFSNKCIDIPNISYAGGIYTVTYTYCLLGEEDFFDLGNNIEIDQNTAYIKLNEDNTWSKFRVVSMDTPIVIKSAEEHEQGIEDFDESEDVNLTLSIPDNTINTIPNDEDDEINTTPNNTTQNTSSNINNYASTMAWKEYWAPGIKFQYPAIFNLEVVGGNYYQTRMGEATTKITGCATGINPDTKEIINSNMNIDVYEPFYIRDIDYNKFSSKVCELFKEYNCRDSGGSFYNKDNKDFRWYQFDAKDPLKEDEFMEIHATYITTSDNTGWIYIIVFKADNCNTFNYKVGNIITWLLGTTKATSY